MGFLSPLPPLGLGSAPLPIQAGLKSPLPVLWSYVGGLPEGTEEVLGGVQSEVSTVFGSITKIVGVSGGVQAIPPTLAGSVLAEKIASGGVVSDAVSITGSVDKYPITGWTLTNFTVNHAGLDPDSPFTDAAFSALESTDKCHFQTNTSPSGSPMSMNGLGEFTITPPSTVIETFDYQIYDISDGTFGTTGTITINPPDADHIISGGVQSEVATVTGTITEFGVHLINGGVQSEPPILDGQVTEGDVDTVEGGVLSGVATVSGTIDRVVTVKFGVQSEPPILSGAINKIVKVSGTIQAEAATVNGTIQAGIILLPANLADVPKRTSKKRKLNRKIKVRSLKR